MTKLNIRHILMITIFYLFTVCFANDQEDLSNDDITPEICVQFDHVAWDGDRYDDFPTGSFVRKIKILLEGKCKENLYYFFDFTFNRTECDVVQSYFKFTKDFWNIKFGRLIPPTSLENAISLRNRIFMENCLMQGVPDDKYFGFTFNINRNFYNVACSLVIPNVESGASYKSNNKSSFFLRAFLSPIKRFRLSSHFGFNYKIIRNNSEEKSPLSYSNFKDVASLSIPYSILLSHKSFLSNYQVVGFEFFSVWKFLSLQSEYNSISADWRDFDIEKYRSWYVQLSFLLSGNPHIYDFKTGGFKNPEPKSEDGDFELAFRYSYSTVLNRSSLLKGVDPNDGEKTSFCCGLNWYVHSNVKVQMNYVYEDYAYRVLSQRKVHGVGFRLQFAF